jgi:L-threonylcarbamoyladenylate synthase
VKTVVTESIDEAASFIKRGGICAFATETVYGLGANILDEKAVAKIFEAKGRPADNPLIVHISTVDQIDELAAGVTPTAQAFVDAFFPGPITIVLQKADHIPLLATAGLDTIGIRMPRFDLARRFISGCGVPLAAPSANLSGRPSPTTWQAVLEDLDGRIDCILQGEPAEIGLESTVVDCTGNVPLVLRPGAVSLEELQTVVPETRIETASSDQSPRSPGMRHQHYAPKAVVNIVDPEFEISNFKSAFIGLNQPSGDFAIERICASVDEYARELFEFFRECDRRSIEVIYCERVENKGIGAAVMDRITRAASRQ